ncbi:TolC family protein [Kiritimatiellaeota bacterium B1221]|nr:TolC family protein [Kiritimatiellaeota bacterium B1221]
MLILCLSKVKADEVLKPLSLEEAVSEAIAHNFSLAASEIEATFPETQLEIAGSNFRWNLRPSFQAERGSDDDGSASAQLQSGRTFSPGTVFEMKAAWISQESGDSGGRLDVNLEQPLFQRFGKLSTYQYVDEATFQLESARLRFHRETENLILRVVTGFTAVLNQEERMRQEMDALIRAADLVRLVEVKKRQGHATGVDVLEMKMLHREAQLRFQQAEEQLILARADLAETMGRVSAQLPSLKPIPQVDEDFPDLAEAEKLAREHRVERTQVLLAYENARRKLKLEERERYPDVRLVGNWRPVDESDESSWFAGLRADRSLDLHVIQLQIEQQENQVQAALLEIGATELQIHREVLQAHSRLKTLAQELEIAEAQLDLSRERLRLAKGLYPSGRTSSLQLRDAEAEWVNAQSQKTDVLLQQVRARYQFWYALGLLLGDGQGE